MRQQSPSRYCIFLCALPLCLLLGAQAALSATGYWQDKRYIERSFYDIVLKAEYSEEKVRPVIKRWASPLRVWVYSGVGDKKAQRRLLSEHLDRLGDIAGLSTRLVKRRQDANVLVFFASEKELGPLMKREMPALARQKMPLSYCMGAIRYNKRAEIVRGTVVIPVERTLAEGKLEACIVEEVTQLLGLINDSKFARHTVFSDLTHNDRLTGLDYLLIRLLYSSAIQPGMDLRQVMPRVRRKLDDWERIGLIRRADQLVSREFRVASAGG